MKYLSLSNPSKAVDWARTLITQLTQRDADLDSASSALTGRVANLETADVSLDARLDVLEAAPSFQATAGGSNQSVANFTNTLVAVPTETFDIGGHFASSRWTPPAGRYFLHGNVRFVAPQLGKFIFLAIRKNGSIVLETEAFPPFTADHSFSISGNVEANGTDYFELWAFTEVNTTIDGNGARTWFSGSRI